MGTLSEAELRTWFDTLPKSAQKRIDMLATEWAVRCQVKRLKMACTEKEIMELTNSLWRARMEVKRKEAKCKEAKRMKRQRKD